MSVNAYLGCKMTGLMCDDMIDAAQHISVHMVENGVTPYHPVLKEDIPYVHEPLTERTPEEMDIIWEADKAAVKWANVIVDTAPHLFSAGLKQEVGKARYRDWKPTVAVFPSDFDLSKVSFITKKEYDFVTNDENEAAKHIGQMWGTRLKRMKWRLPLYLRHPFDISLRKLIQFFD